MTAAGFGSSRGFLLAAIGSAVGLGNIWRFSFVAGDNGGGAFVLVYLLAVFGLGVPLLIAELGIGRSTRQDPIGAFTTLAPQAPWRWAGWLGVAASVLILCYYPVIAGWVASYLWHYAAEGSSATGAENYSDYFDAVIKDPIRAIFWHGVVVSATAAIVAGGVSGGIERASKLLMPVFALLLILLAGYGLSLDGAPRALAFLFRPDWSALTQPATYVAAIGQAFFSIGLAMGVMITYGAYMGDQEKLPRAAITIAAGDTAVALLAGLMIFPAVFTHGLDPAQGPRLAFAVLPEVFAVMPGGRWAGLGFFLLLLIAALTSTVALLEVSVALLISRSAMRRRSAALLAGAGVYLLGVPAALGYGVIADRLPDLPPILDFIDHAASNILLPLSGIAIALVCGWAWRPQMLPSLGMSQRPLAIVWLWILRVVLPLAIVVILIRGVIPL